MANFSTRLKIGEQDYKAEISEEDLIIYNLVSKESPRNIWLCDIEKYEILNGRIKLFIYKNGSIEELEMYYFAENFDNFVSSLRKNRNILMRKNLSMNCDNSVDNFEGEIEYQTTIFTEDGIKPQIVAGKAYISLFTDSIVIETDLGEFINISFNWINKVTFVNNPYSINVLLKAEDRLIVKMLGNKFQDFENILKRLVKEYIAKVETQLRETIQDENMTKQLADKIRLGNIINLLEVESNYQSIKELLTNFVFPDEKRKQTFEFLSTNSKKDYIYWGLIPKESSEEVTSPDGQGTITIKFDTWFYVYLPEMDIIVFEVTSEAGNATYVFKPIIRNKSEIGKFIEEINKVIVMLTFKREPIYLTDDEINSKPEYKKYVLALRKLSYLRALRKCFIGRATHTNFESWKNQIEKYSD